MRAELSRGLLFPLARLWPTAYLRVRNDGGRFGDADYRIGECCFGCWSFFRPTEIMLNDGTLKINRTDAAREFVLFVLGQQK